VPVQGAAVVGDEPFMATNVLEVGGCPDGEQLDQLWVQRDVPVVAERHGSPELVDLERGLHPFFVYCGGIFVFFED